HIVMKKPAVFFAIFLTFLECARAGDPACRVGKMRCEYLSDPVGLDARNPRLSWMMEDTRNGARQSWYRVVVGRDSVSVAAGRGDAWESGKMVSDAQLVVYRGAA